MHQSHDHRALRRAPPTSVFGVLLSIGIGAAALAGVALDRCDARASAPAALGYITWPGGSQAITESDLLPYARVLLGSQWSSARDPAGPTAGAAMRLAVCRNRHALLVRNGHRFARASDSCAAYSTATSPTWAPNGPRCGAGGSRIGHPMCSPHALARRSRISSLSWGDVARIAPALSEYVRRWARGEIPAPPGTERCVHTGGCVLRNGRSSCAAGRRPGAVFAGSNVCWPTRQSAAWSDAEVPRIVPAGTL